jgi:hypothetical protein
VNAGIPQPQREAMIAADFFGELVQIRRGYSQRLLGVAAESRHAGRDGRIGEGIEAFENFCILHRLHPDSSDCTNLAI